jgi:ATP-dependent protease ClpP protease subunit
MTDITNLAKAPNVRLHGPIEADTLESFLEQLAKANESDGTPIVLELTTEGGDADIARRIALEIRLCRKWFGRETYFIGKTIIYSAGISIMAAFPAASRYLTEDATLLIHERRISSSVELKGPMKGNIQILREQLAVMETARRLEELGFAEFAEGSKLSLQELTRRAEENYYVTAQEAEELGFVAGLI